MSELRIVLLGKNVLENNRVGNFILGRAAFETESPPVSVDHHSERARGQVEGRRITVVSTPDLFHPQFSHHQLIQTLRECVYLSAPGPHVFILVLQPDSFTEEDRDKVKNILNSFSDQALDYTMVLTVRETSHHVPDFVWFEESHSLCQIIKDLKMRQHTLDIISKFDQNKVCQLFERIKAMLEENGGGFVICEEIEGLLKHKGESHSNEDEGAELQHDDYGTVKRDEGRHSDGEEKRADRPEEYQRKKKKDSMLMVKTNSSPVKGQKVLRVTCGNKEGILYTDNLNKGELCIFSEGRWFSPPQFEDFGGKKRNKKWKHSIYHENTPLQKLIEEGHLKIPSMKNIQGTESKQILFQSSSSDSTSSCISHSLKKRENDRRAEGERGEEEREEREQAEERSLVGDVDVSEFQSLTLSITCGSATATLHKQRFASGAYGKCIRTEERWWTPMEFVEQNSTLDNSHWKRDIYCCGKPLSFLLQMKILEAHSVLCDCKQCSRLEEDVQEQNNDDECFICDGVGDLICCDECPRSFHHQCHLPTVDPDLLGEQWICTFCLLRKWQSWRYSSHMTLEEVLNSPVSQYKLQCQYLLLCLYKEDVKRVFGPNPCTIVPGYSNDINKVMNLETVTEKLQEDQYETLDQLNSDIQLIFQNCATFNKDNKFGRMGARLKDLFERKFQSIFNIQ